MGLTTAEETKVTFTVTRLMVYIWLKLVTPCRTWFTFLELLELVLVMVELGATVTKVWDSMITVVKVRS